MDFEAVIRAVFKPGDAEAQIQKLIKDREVKITPTFASTTTSSLSSSEKKAIDNQAKKQATYIQTAQKKYSSAGVYTAGDTKVSKARVSAKLKEADEIQRINQRVIKDTNASYSQANSAVKKSLNEQQKQLTAAQKIIANLQNDTYSTNFTKSKTNFGSFADDGSEAYQKASKSIKEYEQALRNLNSIGNTFNTTPNVENANKLIQANERVAQSTKTLQNNLRLLSSEQSNRNKLFKEYEREVVSSAQSQAKAIKEANKISANVQSDSYLSNFTKAKANFDSFANDGSNAYKKAANSIKEYESAMKRLSTATQAFNNNKSVENANKLSQAHEKVSQSAKELQNNLSMLNTQEAKAISGGANIQKSNQIKKYLDENTKAAKKYGNQLETLAQQAKEATTTGQLSTVDNDFKNLKSQISAEGLTGNSIFSELKRGFSQITEFVGVYGILQSAMNKASEMVQNTYDVNDAMIELRMATGLSNDEAQKTMRTYAQMGNQLKATATDVATASTEWMKQGQTIEKANELSKYSIMLSKIGNISSEDATKYLTSARKGYGITSAEDTLGIIDKISAVDMASATDVGGLAEGMSEVATNANIAGVSMDKLLSYLAVVGETTQEGMSSVGIGFNAIFSRMGNIKLARLKDYQNNGEDLKTWGMVV